jgi:MFS family permease
MIALTGGLIALMFVIYQGSGWGWFDIRTLGLAVAGIALLGAFPWIEKRAADPLIPTDLMRNREMQVLCLAVMVICEMFFVVLLYFTQFAMKFLGQDPISAGARVIPFMLSYGIVSYCGAQLTAWLGTRRLLLGGMACGALAATLIAWVGPDGDWPLFYGSLILLGIGVGAVIPTVSARAIETAGSERAGLATGITFMAQLAGSAALLVVYTAIFRATSRSSINAQLQSADVTLTGEEEVAVSHLVSGGGTIHGLPRSTSDAIPDLAAIVQTGYEHGLAIVMFLCGASALVTLVLMWRVLPRNLPPTNNIST